jgi:hypothetical protein
MPAPPVARREVTGYAAGARETSRETSIERRATLGVIFAGAAP